jgi:tetratricopeptide (TPR) repeat protein
VTDSPSFADLNAEIADDPEPSSTVAVLDDGGDVDGGDLARDDDGCISIDCDESASFESLMDDLAGVAESAIESNARNESGDAGADPASSGAGGSVNLLDEILAEEGEDILRSTDTEQMSTIASEIGRNVGEHEDADPEAQYQQGLVYLEMGMHDQAVLALEAASRSEEFGLQAREMWGIALQRDGRREAALEVFEAGLAVAEPGDRMALGLRYHAGCILQEIGRRDEALEYFRTVHVMDAGFADVAQRLRTLDD